MLHFWTAASLYSFFLTKTEKSDSNKKEGKDFFIVKHFMVKIELKVFFS